MMKMKMNSAKISSGKISSKKEGAGGTFFSHSDLSPLRTSIMPSTPRSMPAL
jgi:hypothetical protein